MRCERQLLRAGEYLVRRACRRLPRQIRDERYREWATELPAILRDPDVRLPARRAVRMLCYAADTIRGTALASGRARHRSAARTTVVISLRIVPWLVYAAFVIWVPVAGDRVHFALLALMILGLYQLATRGLRRLIMLWARRARRD
jgi:hypothetical protein